MVLRDIQKRLMDIVICIISFVILTPLMLLAGVSVKLTSKGPIFHSSLRIGKNSTKFIMPKFRTMYIDAPDLPTHLLEDAEKYITPVGRLLRRTSIDELPQIWSVLIGKMSIVGPRPALHSQDDLIKFRKQYKIDNLLPGITGWAQVNGRDDISLDQKVTLDIEYAKNRSLFFDLKIIVITLYNLFSSSNISH